MWFDVGIGQQTKEAQAHSCALMSGFGQLTKEAPSDVFPHRRLLFQLTAAKAERLCGRPKGSE